MKRADVLPAVGHAVHWANGSCKHPIQQAIRLGPRLQVSASWPRQRLPVMDLQLPPLLHAWPLACPPLISREKLGLLQRFRI